MNKNGSCTEVQSSPTSSRGPEVTGPLEEVGVECTSVQLTFFFMNFPREKEAVGVLSLSHEFEDTKARSGCKSSNPNTGLGSGIPSIEHQSSFCRIWSSNLDHSESGLLIATTEGLTGLVKTRLFAIQSVASAHQLGKKLTPNCSSAHAHVQAICVFPG